MPVCAERVAPRLPRAPLVDVLGGRVLGQSGHAKQLSELGVGRRPAVPVLVLVSEALRPEVVRREVQRGLAGDAGHLPPDPSLSVGVVLELDAKLTLFHEKHVHEKTFMRRDESEIVTTHRRLKWSNGEIIITQWRVHPGSNSLHI